MPLGDEWELRPNGDIACCPVMGWQTATMSMAGLVRLEYFPGPEELRTGATEALQLVLTPAQARTLSEDLLKMATRIEQQPLGPRQ